MLLRFTLAAVRLATTISLGFHKELDARPTGRCMPPVVVSPRQEQRARSYHFLHAASISGLRRATHAVPAAFQLPQIGRAAIASARDGHGRFRRHALLHLYLHTDAYWLYLKGSPMRAIALISSVSHATYIRMLRFCDDRGAHATANTA